MVIRTGQALKPLSNAERQDQLVYLIERNHRLTISQIAELFEVSQATARRDLKTLSDQGKIKRVHGGAIAVRQAPPEPPVVQRSLEMIDEKKRIGIAAAQLVKDGETVLLSSGSTVLGVAQALKNRHNLTVITNSLLVINALAGCPDITLISLGGFLRPSEMSFIGHIVEQALTELRADKVIMGIRAIDIDQGLTNDYLPETMTDRAILHVGRQVIIVADHTKLGCVSTAFVAPVKDIHILVTSQAAPPDFVAKLRDLGVRVMAV
jgi:DeoR/GlpR family transcriptional regulator of sugar metabolism